MVITSKQDLDDQRWLDHQVALLGEGLEAAHDIWANWADLRNVGRLHPGMSAGEYIESLGFRLTLSEAMAALPEGSTREIAKVAGVSHSTVVRNRGGANAPPGRPARVIGADGKSYPGRVVGTADIIEPEKKEAKFQKDLTVTEVRRYIKTVEMSLALLLPDQVVRGAIPVIREFTPKIEKWLELWDQSEK